MESIFKATLLSLISFWLLGCASPEEQTDSKINNETTSDTEINNSAQLDEKISTIDEYRSMVESFDIEPIEISTATLREKIKQKWNKLHFYMKDDAIIKVKSYPYPEISKRTEEFYIKENKLVLVVIEDNGDGDKGKPKNEIDKMYYFNDDKVIQEISNQKESEYTIRQSDAEELLAEFNEYLQILNELKN